MTRRDGGGGAARVVAGAMLLAVALGGAGSALPAHATMVANMSTAAQATAADRIFVGTVASITSRRKADRPQWFETVVRLTVEETVAGTIPANVELVYSGGEVDGVLQRVDGMPELVVGARYVVLLEPEQTPRLTSPFVGFNQGVYRVIGDQRATAVVRDREGRPLATDAVPAGARAAGGDPTLDAFLATLRAARQ